MVKELNIMKSPFLLIPDPATRIKYLFIFIEYKYQFNGS